jgi:hypothetical protein
VVFFTGFSPGTCDIVRVVLSSVLPSVLVFVRDLLNVPLSTAWAFVCAFSLSPLSLTWVLLCAFPSVVAALPPDPIEEVVPSSVRQVPAVPTELADVPPAEALPPVPTVPAALHSSARTAELDASSAIEAAAIRLIGFIAISYFLGFMTEQVPSDRLVMMVPSGRVMLAVEKLSTLPDPAEEPAEEDDEEEPADPLPVVVDDETCPLPAVTVVDMSPCDDRDSTTVHVVPSSSLISSDIACPATKASEAPSAIVEKLVIGLSPRIGRRHKGAGRHRQQPLVPAASFLTCPGAQPFLPLLSELPAALPPVPTVLPVLSPSADEAPVPTLEAEFASPEPAAEPPVPTELLEVPPPADEPPVPSVEADPEPEPEPAAEPPVPTVLLEVPPPADEPPVPSVEDEPELQLVAPAGQVPPAELPPVPTVLLAVPPPADEPPVPTVLDD